MRSLIFPAQSQMNHHGIPLSVNHPFLHQDMSNHHAPSTILCLLLPRIDGSILSCEFPLFRFVLQIQCVQLNRFDLFFPHAGNPPFLHQQHSNPHAPTTIPCLLLPRINGCVFFCKFLWFCLSFWILLKTEIAFEFFRHHTGYPT